VLKQVKGKPLGCFWANAGKPCQGSCKRLEAWGHEGPFIGFGHEKGEALKA
jgi:hypothetical protein